MGDMSPLRVKDRPHGRLLAPTRYVHGSSVDRDRRKTPVMAFPPLLAFPLLKVCTGSHCHINLSHPWCSRPTSIVDTRDQRRRRRLTQTTEGPTTVITIDGPLLGDGVAELALDLTHPQQADADGLARLKALADAGAQRRVVSPSIALLLDRPQA
jgi:hypothetical protein